ncbi:MAG: hypothetical protein QXG03_10690 [Halalkalicoccus sp.]
MQQRPRLEFGVQDRIDRLLSGRISADVGRDDDAIEEASVHLGIDRPRWPGSADRPTVARFSLFSVLEIFVGTASQRRKPSSDNGGPCFQERSPRAGSLTIGISVRERFLLGHWSDLFIYQLNAK